MKIVPIIRLLFFSALLILFLFFFHKVHAAAPCDLGKDVDAGQKFGELPTISERSFSTASPTTTRATDSGIPTGGSLFANSGKVSRDRNRISLVALLN
jgi:hypothetical protein